MDRRHNSTAKSSVLTYTTRHAVMRNIHHFISAIKRTTLALLLLCAATLFTAGAARAQTNSNYSDLWWMPAESGWGLSIADHESTLFAVYYTYDSAGRSTWFTIPGGSYSSDKRFFSGDVYATNGPSYAAMPFNSANVTATKVGTATFDFAPPALATGNATFQYTINGITQSKTISRQPFDSAPISWANDLTDLWWNSAESGWGLSLNQKGNNTFGIFYTYDTNGAPLFATLPGVTETARGIFTGALFTTTGPFFAITPFNPALVTAQNVGSAQLQMNSLRDGYFIYTINNQTQIKNIIRQSFGATLPNATTFQLTVNAGTKAGATTYGSALHIFANPAPANTVFDRWTGDTALLLDPFSWHTSLTIPASGSATITATVSATYKVAPAWTPTIETGATIPGLTTASGVRAIYYFPPNARGLVIRFHGTGGGAPTSYTKVEDRQFMNEAVAAGYAVLALDSDNRIDKQWNVTVTANNIDVLNIRAVLSAFSARGLISATTPLMMIGMSNGAAMAPRAAYILSTASPQLNVRASASYCASGNATIMSLTAVPQLWGMAANDDNENVGAEGNRLAAVNRAILSARGLANSFRLNPAAPLATNRFARITGLSLADSLTIWQAIQARGLLDQDGYLRTNNIETIALAIPTPFNTAALLDDIADQIDATFAGHKFYSDDNARTIRFFNSRLP
jgi:hypothetical protein